MVKRYFMFVMMSFGGSRVITTLRAAVRNRGRWCGCQRSWEVIMLDDRGKWLVVTSTRPFTLRVMGCGPWLVVVIACKTRLLQSMVRTIISECHMLIIWMCCVKPSGCYVYKCRLIFLEAVRIWKARHVYPDEDDPDGDACHVSPWGVRHVFSGGGVPIEGIKFKLTLNKTFFALKMI